MIKTNLFKLSVTALGFLFTAIAYAGVNVASWTVIHNEPVPDELK
ncbi:cyclic lactone autoinducer peptide [Paenibacillus xylanexedens]|nr:cyclic lactone autoinducer peptide [Paenibacillus xylanexedens]